MYEAFLKVSTHPQRYKKIIKEKAKYSCSFTIFNYRLKVTYIFFKKNQVNNFNEFLKGYSRLITIKIGKLIL